MIQELVHSISIVSQFFGTHRGKERPSFFDETRITKFKVFWSGERHLSRKLSFQDHDVNLSEKFFLQVITDFKTGERKVLNRKGEPLPVFQGFSQILNEIFRIGPQKWD